MGNCGKCEGFLQEHKYIEPPRFSFLFFLLFLRKTGKLKKEEKSTEDVLH